MKQEKWTIEAADAYLNAIPKFTSEKHTAEGLRRMLLYLNAMPQEEKIVHVAGTNGKGSVCSFLDAILREAGVRTARFTSPHLVCVTERFSFEGQEVDDALFLEAFEAVKNSYVHFEQEGLGHPTYFEYLFLMFMWMVRRKKPEYVILETGLGGRLDATNCIEHPALTVITSISLDHMEYLGDTVTQIAGEKAGILKKGVPVVYDDTDAAASAVIRAQSAELSCPAYPTSSAAYTDLRREHGGMSLMVKEKLYGFGSSETVSKDTVTSDEWKKLFIPFEAEYQAVNACIAYQAARLLAVDGNLAAAGIRNAVWRGRMEEIQNGVYLDGAHNEGGIRAFSDAAAAIAAQRKQESKGAGRVFLLFAAVSDKNYESMLETLMRKLKPDRLVLTHLYTSRALPMEAMEKAARWVADRIAEDEENSAHLEKKEAEQLVDNIGNKAAEEKEDGRRGVYKTEIQRIPDVKTAYQTLIQEKRPEDTCFCVGSLYLIGELEAFI